jgi:hypothetical protein
MNTSSAHVALGYRWFPTAAGYHIERALQSLDCAVTFVGLSEHGRAGYGEATSIASIVEAMPSPPDFFLWIDPAGRYFPLGIEELSIPTACYLIDVHLGHWRSAAAGFFDVVFVAQKDYVAPLRQVVGHDQVFWLPLAAAIDVHYDHNIERIFDVGFVGNLARAHQQTARARRLHLLRDQFQTNDFYRHYTPAQVGEAYSQAKIVFNTSIAGDVTMRVFEGSACGALVITDAVQNGLTDLFRPGEEIVVFQDDADLIEKILFYLDHPQERQAVAQAGQARTLAQHTYRHRARQIVDVMASPGLKHAAPMRTASAAQRNAARRKIYTHLHMLDALFDLERASGAIPLLRFWHALPCLVRRVLM